VGGVSGDRSIITGRQETSLLFRGTLLRPELEATLEVEEVLIMLLVHMG
jgi:hypothetical protein